MDEIRTERNVLINNTIIYSQSVNKNAMSMNKKNKCGTKSTKFHNTINQLVKKMLSMSKNKNKV